MVVLERALALGSIAVSVFVVGCAMYQPRGIHEARDGDSLVRLTGARSESGALSVQGYSNDPSWPKVRAAWLASPSAPSCRDGWPGILSWQEADTSFWEWWRASGARTKERHFEIAFLQPSSSNPLLRDSVVDVQLDTPRAPCLRVPMAGSDPALSWSGGGRWYAGLALRYALVKPTIDDANEAASFVLRFGRWMHPLRLTGEAGAGLHSCGTCDNSRGFVWLEGALGLEGFVVRRNGWALGIEGAYTFLPAVGHASTNQVLVHGPRLALRLVYTERAYPGLPSGPEVRVHGIELFAAERLFAGDHVGGLVIGLGLVMDYGIWL